MSGEFTDFSGFQAAAQPRRAASFRDATPLPLRFLAPPAQR